MHSSVKTPKGGNSRSPCGGELEEYGDGGATFRFTPSEDQVSTGCTLDFLCTDTSGLTDTQTASLLIHPSPTVEIIANLPATGEAHWDAMGTYQLEVYPQYTSQNLTWSIARSDCSFVPILNNEGLIAWRCTALEECTLTAHVSPNQSPNSYDEALFTMRCTNTAPTLTQEGSGTASVGLLYRHTFTCTDDDNDPVALSIDTSRDTCLGTLDGTSYLFTPTEAQGTSCTMGVFCTDSQNHVTTSATVLIQESQGATSLRIVAANLTSGNLQAYDGGHGIRIIQGLAPDIVLVQEMNYVTNTPADYTAFATALVGTSHYGVDDPLLQIPNGVVSRWPILQSGYWDDPTLNNRELFWAEIDLPGPRDLFVVSVHLHSGEPQDQTEAANVVVDGVLAHQQANPGLFYYIVGGDFNGPTAASSVAFGRAGTFVVTAPFPADQNGDTTTNRPRSTQLDYILEDPDLHLLQVSSRFPSLYGGPPLTYPNGFVFDTRLFTQSELDEYFAPALISDSAAQQMQHMAVVKDYHIP